MKYLIALFVFLSSFALINAQEIILKVNGETIAVEEIYIGGHSYLYFGNQSQMTFNIVHHPDCFCFYNKFYEYVLNED